MIATDKGNALDTLRHQVGASAAVYFGDDTTDERAFARLHGPDVGIKVGEGASTQLARVIRTDGSLGGFRWGLAIKKSLLARESKESLLAREAV